MSLDNLVNTATVYGMDDRVSTPGKGFFFCYRVQTKCGTYTASHQTGTGRAFPEIKQPDPEDERLTYI